MKSKQNWDYFGAIGRMGDSVMPKQKAHTQYRDINFGIPIVNIGFPTMDPYPKSEDRFLKKFMHGGPAEEKQLNKKQMAEVIHQLKEKNSKIREVVHAAKEARALSRRYMNKPWVAVPERYRQKYGMFDFDADGIPNKSDCYPFDYDRQAIISFGSNKSSSAAKVSTPAPKTTTSSKSKTSSGTGLSGVGTLQGTGTNRLGQTVYTYKDSSGKYTESTKAPNISIAPQTTTQTSTKSSGSRGSGSSTYFGATSSSNPFGVYTAPTQSRMPKIGDKKVGTSTIDGITYDVMSGSGGSTYLGGYSDISKLPTGGSVSSGTISSLTTSGNVPTAAAGKSPIEPEYFDAWIEKYVPNYTTMADWEKYNALYESIQSGKITDPEFIAKYNSLIKPYMDAYNRRVAGASAALALKAKKQGLIGASSAGSSLLQRKSAERAQNILQKRADVARAGVEEKATEIEKAKNKELSAFVTSELDKRSGEYMTNKVESGGSIVRTSEWNKITAADLSKLRDTYGSKLHESLRR